MTRQRCILALAGLSGVGKSSLIASLRDPTRYAHLTASELIKVHLGEEGLAPSSEALRKGDIPNNQGAFVEAFRAAIDGEKRHILLDCHTLIDTPKGVQLIPVETFAAIHISHFVFMSLDPAELLARRKEDRSRSRPELPVDVIAKQQILAKRVAVEVADALNIPFTDIGASPRNLLRSILNSLPAVDETRE